MTTLSQSTKRKLSLLQLAEEPGNVSKACKLMGYHRDTFYEVRRAFQVGGVAALVEKRGPRNPHPNRVAPEIEQKILDYALSFPTHGPQRVSNELRLAGTEVSPTGVRGVWLRHGIKTRYKRLMRLSSMHRAIYRAQRHPNPVAGATLRRVPLPARGSIPARGTTEPRHVSIGGTLKGVGKVYVRVCICLGMRSRAFERQSWLRPIARISVGRCRVWTADREIGSPPIGSSPNPDHRTSGTGGDVRSAADRQPRPG